MGDCRSKGLIMLEMRKAAAAAAARPSTHPLLPGQYQRDHQRPPSLRQICSPWYLPQTTPLDTVMPTIVNPQDRPIWEPWWKLPPNRRLIRPFLPMIGRPIHCYWIQACQRSQNQMLHSCPRRPLPVLVKISFGENASDSLKNDPELLLTVARSFAGCAGPGVDT